LERGRGGDNERPLIVRMIASPWTRTLNGEHRPGGDTVFGLVPDRQNQRRKRAAAERHGIVRARRVDPERRASELVRDLPEEENPRGAGYTNFASTTRP
jgi:hypothetical protein